MPDDTVGCTCPHHVTTLAHQGRTCAEVLWRAYAAQTQRQWPPDALWAQGRAVPDVLAHALQPEDAHGEAV